MEELTTKDIMTMFEAGAAKGKELGTPSAIAIADVGGNLVGFLRPEGGRISTISLAIQKAWTAIALKRPTAQITPIVQPGAFGYGINITEPRILPVGGGLPITKNGVDYLGGIGVSGGTVEMDIAMCEAALNAGGFQAEFAQFEYGKK